MNKSLSIVILVLLFTANYLLAQKQYTMEVLQSASFLSKIATKMNQNMPQFIDEHTRIDNVIGFKKIIRYNYAFVKYKKGTIKNEQNELMKSSFPLASNEVKNLTVCFARFHL